MGKFDAPKFNERGEEIRRTNAAKLQEALRKRLANAQGGTRHGTGRGMYMHGLYREEAGCPSNASVHSKRKDSRCDYDRGRGVVTMDYRAVLRRTERSAHVAMQGRRYWLPLSQIEFLPENTIEMPFWLARKKGLLNAASETDKARALESLTSDCPGQAY